MIISKNLQIYTFLRDYATTRPAFLLKRWLYRGIFAVLLKGLYAITLERRGQFKVFLRHYGCGIMLDNKVAAGTGEVG